MVFTVSKQQTTLALIFLFLLTLNHRHTALAIPTSRSVVKSVQSNLRKIGWPIAVDGAYGPQTKEAVRNFQRGWTFKKLAVDGIAGPKTIPQIKSCVKKGGRASAHFKFAEFKSNGNGDIRVDRKLISGLEKLRSAMGNKPMTIISGYRDLQYNRKIGSSDGSQHIKGNAADISRSYGATVTKVRSLKFFTGYGIKCGKWVTHVDVRTGRSASSPATWTYPC